MTEPDRPTIKKLFALSGNRCAFPKCDSRIIDESGTVTGQICHIHAKSKGGPRFKESLPIKERHAYVNLILLCANHHKVIDAQPQTYTAETLSELKMAHESSQGRPETLEDGFFAQFLLNAYKSATINNNSGNIAINSPGAIQGKVVTIKTGKTKLKIEPPPGSLGADLDRSKYIGHLISRYNDFASIEPGRNFSYGAVSKSMESKFGARWQLLGMEHFQSVVTYLQDRILQTRQARINRGKGHPAFSTWEEYAEKYGGRHD